MPRTADLTINAYWSPTRKTWTFVARDNGGSVLATTTVDSSVALDRAGTALLLRALKDDLLSRLG